MTKKNKSIEKTIAGIGWYKEDQWDLLLRNAEDKDDLETTYAEWLEGISKGMKALSKSGVQCEKIPVDVEEIIQWCRDKGYPFDGASRSLYFAIKTKEIFG
ncbi:MAG: hypothetical protein KJ804_12975 [Proteobacteria bacterium]|nr:hypothetical protein [Pseudomonadota bacterium]MBU1059219.1 hypothetical protein [Pseudomonadota bacterium]